MNSANPTVQGAGLSFLAGYVDTLGFVALFGLFTAHVTGNFVLIGRELANPSHSVLLKFLAFPAFIAAVAATRLLIVWLERIKQGALFYALLLQLLLLIGFMVFGCLGMPTDDADAPLVLVAGILGAAAMGVQNAYVKLLLSTMAPSTVMTGNVTQLVIDLVDIARGDGDDALKARCSKFFWPIVAFGLGAIAAAFVYKMIGFIGLLLPCFILLWLAVEASPLPQWKKQ